jgi:hypothetical protein
MRTIKARRRTLTIKGLRHPSGPVTRPNPAGNRRERRAAKACAKQEPKP